MCCLFWHKAVGITLFMWAFFAAYFYLLQHPSRAPFLMPLTSIDRALAFQPNALLAYASLWLYVSIPPGLLMSRRELFDFGLWVGGLCAVGLLCFYLWPTAVPALLAPVDLVQYPAFAVLQGVDAAGNACPSLHVATAVFAAVWIDHLLRDMRAPHVLRAFSIVWLLLIVHSTLATKQHVLLDVLAGVALGLPFAWASVHWRPRERPGRADIMRRL